jgi:hypothetical protein
MNFAPNVRGLGGPSGILEDVLRYSTSPSRFYTLVQMLYHNGCQQLSIADLVQAPAPRTFREVLERGCGITLAKS